MKHYFYIDAEGKQQGPYAPWELRNHPIRRNTLVWREGMDNWVTADKDPDIQFIFAENAPVPYPLARENVPQEPMPKTWLLESILATILPFMLCGSVLSLLGIVGIVYSSQVESHYLRGDYNTSLVASRSARKWTRIALFIFIGWIVLWVIAFILLVGILGWGSFTDVENLIDV